jgi:hypothetical protein
MVDWALIEHAMKWLRERSISARAAIAQGMPR